MGRSILFGLMLWQVAVLSLVLAGFSALLLWQIRRSAHEELERDLAGMAELLATRVHELSEGQSEASLAEWLGIPKWKAKDDRPYFAVYEAGGSLVAASASLFAPPPPPTPPRSLDKKRRPVFSRERAGALEVIAVQPSGTMVLVGKSMLHEQRREFFATMWIVGSAAGCLVLGVLGQALLARRAVRPIRAMAAAAGAIDFGNLAQRLDLRETRTELGELGHKFNAMLDRLQDAFERQTAFTADASHELRTPLAVIQAQIELALSRNRAPDEYRQALEACDRAAKRMSELAASLLTLADADAGQLIRDREPCDLRVIVEKTIAMLAPLAKVRLVDVRPSVGPAMVDGDPLRLAQLVENLLSNAIRYNRKGGSVEVSVCADQDVVKLTISDTGLGIPRECLPHVFQRFYRADQGRARSDGGAGLGLAICEEIVRAHDGTVRIDSEPGLGTVVQVELPGSERRPHGTN